MKYSIIIPAYNAQNYIHRCIRSILEQTYNNYEIIIVNDGSTDNTGKIIEEYEKKYDFIKVITQPNKGPSEARNKGVDYINGDYFIFLDSDDYLDKKLLEQLNESLDNKPDLVRYQIKEVDEAGLIIKEYKEKEFYNLNGIEAFHNIVNYKYIDNPYMYLYSTKYYKDNNFKFISGIYHEDYALIPSIIIKSKIVNSINYLGYNYSQINGSIMHSYDYNSIRKKAFDTIIGYKELIKHSQDKIYKSYISNIVILKAKGLKKQDYKSYINELKKLKVYDNLLNDTTPRKIKNFIIKHFLKLYLFVRG